MTRYLVTGGAGFIGSSIAKRLVRDGMDVRVLDNLSTGFLNNLDPVREELEFIRGDICDAAAVAKAVQGVDVIYHQAALASVPRSLKNPLATHLNCATGTLTVLHEAQQAGVRRLVYAASSSAYGDQPFSSKRESDFPSPLSPYAAAKLAGEFYCKAFSASFDLETVGLRYFNVFGPHQDPEGEYSAVIPRFVTRLLRNERPVVYGDGEQSRDFTFIENVVDANMLAGTASNASGRVFNIGNGQTTSLNQLLRILGSLLQVDVSPIYEAPRQGDVRNSLADISLAREVLGYEPAMGVEAGLRASIDYYRDSIVLST